jgi:cell wall-associated NlpC family hydrolase
MLVGDQIANKAREYIGFPYVWATHGPNTFDCSGLVHWCVLQVTSDSISPASSTQYTLGTAVTQANLQRGDVMCFDTVGDGGCHHVGIYDGIDSGTGQHRMVNALNESAGVVVSNPFSPYFSPLYLGSRRLYAEGGSTGDDPDPPPINPPQYHKVGTVLKVTSVELALRETPEILANVVATLPQNRIVVVIDGTPVQVQGDDFYKVRTRDGDGWATVLALGPVAVTNHVANPTANSNLNNIAATGGSTISMYNNQVRVITSPSQSLSGVAYKSATLALSGPRTFIGIFEARGPSATRNLSGSRLHGAYTDGASGTTGPMMPVEPLLTGTTPYVTPVMVTPSGRILKTLTLYIRNNAVDGFTFHTDNARIIEL